MKINPLLRFIVLGAEQSETKLAALNLDAGQHASTNRTILMPSPLNEKISIDKICTTGLGVCSDQCSDPFCDTNCAQKYPGGRGYCQDIVPPLRSCYCVYNCTNA